MEAVHRGRELGRVSKLAWTSLGIFLVVLFGALDYVTGPFVSFEIFFLAPIFLVAWFSGPGPATLIALASATAWLAADLLSHPDLAHSIVPYWNAAVKFAFFFLMTLVLPAVKEEWERDRRSARVDYLTGTANKRCFEEIAAAEIERSRRYRHPFSVAYIDVDNFKKINDRLGHNAGDNLLQTTAQAIKGKIRSVDLLGRLGGDEFALLMPETQPEAAAIVVTRLRAHLLDVFEKNEWPATVSIGAVTFLQPPDSVEEMLHKADTLMYDAKSGGKNAVRLETHA